MTFLPNWLYYWQLWFFGYTSGKLVGELQLADGAEVFSDLGRGIGVTEDTGGSADGLVGREVGEGVMQPIRRWGEESGVAGGNGFGSVGGVAHDGTGDPEGGRFFLEATGVGNHPQGCSERVDGTLVGHGWNDAQIGRKLCIPQSWHECFR